MFCFFFALLLLLLHLSFWASLVARMVKNPPATQETRGQSLGWDDPLEKGIATHSSAWRIPWTEKPGGLQSMGCRVRCDWATSSFSFNTLRVVRGQVQLTLLTNRFSAHSVWTLNIPWASAAALPQHLQQQKEEIQDIWILTSALNYDYLQLPWPS